MTSVLTYTVYLVSLLVLPRNGQVDIEWFVETGNGPFHYLASGVTFNESLQLKSHELLEREMVIDKNGQLAPLPNIPPVIRDERTDYIKLGRRMMVPGHDWSGTCSRYELRSGMLIPVYVSINGIYAVPIHDGVILELRDYYYCKSSSIIYNRPGRFTIMKAKDGIALPWLPNLGVVYREAVIVSPESWQIKSSDYHYVQAERTNTYRRLGGYFFKGKYDIHGKFFWDATTAPLEVQKTDPQALERVLCSRVNEPVYEFRSGMLVPGRIDAEYFFIPEKGAKIKAFKDYDYPNDPRRIYNLPGEFVPKKKK
jgi:hypothetical protein